MGNRNRDHFWLGKKALPLGEGDKRQHRGLPLSVKGVGGKNETSLISHFSLFLCRLSFSHCTPGHASLPDISPLSQTRHLPLQQITTALRPHPFRSLHKCQVLVKTSLYHPHLRKFPKGFLTHFSLYHLLPSIHILHIFLTHEQTFICRVAHCCSRAQGVSGQSTLTKYLLTERMNEWTNDSLAAKVNSLGIWPIPSPFRKCGLTFLCSSEQK